VIIFLFLPFISQAQHYIIEEIPDHGDDGLDSTVTIKRQAPNVSGATGQVTTSVSASTTETKTKESSKVADIVLENEKTFQFLGTVGAFMGMAMAMATTAIPFFTTNPTLLKDLSFLNLVGVFVKKKKERRWGIVFDMDTKLPVLAAKVMLFDSNMKELETTYSDKEGRFGFLAGEGSYNIDVYKKDYEMFTEMEKDDLHGELYTGQELRIEGDEILSVNVAMRSTNINWKEYADKKVKEYTSTWSLVKKYLFRTLYVIGLLATIAVTIVQPTTLNIILFVVDVIIFCILIFYKRKDHGTVSTSDDNPVPFAVVNLYDEAGRKNAFAVTDVVGRYYMLTDNGEYTMKASGQPVGGEKKEVGHDVHVRNKILDKDIVL
ncbi:MAG: carboxypeptidase-like regulatory domain-containing protein, partial [Patescibacteria group bacterium]